MSNEMMTKPLEVIKKTLARQNEQGQMMIQMVEYVESIASNVKEVEVRTEKKFSEIEEVQNRLEKQITLTRGEQGQLRSAVLSKSTALTYKFFKAGVSDELFNAKRGHTLSYIWIVLKDYYDVATYPEISHVEFENAMNVVNHLTIEDFPEAYYRLTPKMREIANRNRDSAMHIYFGENSNQDELF